MRVGREIARSPQALEFRAEQCKVVIRRLCNMNTRQLEPGLQPFHYVLNRKWPSNHSAVRRDAHKTDHRRPRWSDAFGTR
jgi:hypothetical protein